MTMGTSACARKMASYVYKLISLADSRALQDAKHACHVMIHSPLPDVLLFNRIPVKHAIMMQMRFDGRLGFPGGFVDETDASHSSALQRELGEEMGMQTASMTFGDDCYVCSHYCAEKALCLHFYQKELPFEDFRRIESRSEDVPYAGFEVLGLIRVPLYALRDGRSGFPAFMRNNFVGNSKEQLLLGIRHCGLLDEPALSDLLLKSAEADPMSDSTNGSAEVSDAVHVLR